MKTPTMVDGMRKSWLEGVSDLLKMTWTVGAGARMHHWLDLIPDQAFSPSAGVGGGRGGARPGEAVKPGSWLPRPWLPRVGRRGPDSPWNACWGNLCLLRPAWRRACSRCFQPWLRAGPGRAHATKALQCNRRHTSG